MITAAGALLTGTVRVFLRVQLIASGLSDARQIDAQLIRLLKHAAVLVLIALAAGTATANSADA